MGFFMGMLNRIWRSGVASMQFKRIRITRSRTTAVG